MKKENSNLQKTQSIKLFEHEDSLYTFDQDNIENKSEELIGDYCSRFSERLRELIDKNHYSRKYIADKLGMTRQAVSNYCLGSSKPTIENLIKLSNIFNVSTDYLLGITDTPTVDIKLRQICNYTGLSEEAINNICKINKFTDSYILSKTIGHNDFIGLFNFVISYLYNKDVNHYESSDIDKKQLANLLNCDSSSLDKILNMATQKAIEETFMNIVNDINYYGK